jgi:hypothetical protein
MLLFAVLLGWGIFVYVSYALYVFLQVLMMSGFPWLSVCSIPGRLGDNFSSTVFNACIVSFWIFLSISWLFSIIVFIMFLIPIFVCLYTRFLYQRHIVTYSC